ncbi:MAG: hypothetical protein HZC54_10780 [Verrucomicrobia bacterium]|nr:hypothetical protein [Verrucomicrobiota bacterium]
MGASSGRFFSLAEQSRVVIMDAMKLCAALLAILASGLIAFAADSGALDVNAASNAMRLLAAGQFDDAVAQLDAPELHALAALKSRLLAAFAAKPSAPVTLFLRNGVVVAGSITAASPADLTVTKLGNVTARVAWSDLKPASFYAVLGSAADPRSADEQLGLGVLARSIRMEPQAQAHFAAAFDLDPLLASHITFWSGQPLNARQQAVLNAAAQMATLFKGRVRPLAGGRIEVSYDFSKPDQLCDWRGVGGTSNDWKIANGALTTTALAADPLLWRAAVTGSVDVTARLNLPEQGYTAIGLAQWTDSEPPNGMRTHFAAIKNDRKFALRNGTEWAGEVDILKVAEPFVVTLATEARQLRVRANDAAPLTTPLNLAPSLIALRGGLDTKASYDDIRITAALDPGWLATERWLRGSALLPKPVRMDSAKPWQDSGLDLQQGRRYRCIARGDWNSSPLFGPSTADGSSTLDNALGASLRNQSLVGRVGANGRPFQLGCDIIFTSPGSGRLFMQVNAVRLDGYKGALEVLLLPADGGMLK